MYKSPIATYIDLMQRKIVADMESNIMKSVANYGVTVDKEELLKALSYDRGQYDKGYEDGKNANKWIPCSERLPEEEGYYLTSMTEYDGYKVRVYNFDPNDGQDVFCWLEDVDAWQPLPEPYVVEPEEEYE